MKVQPQFKRKEFRSYWGTWDVVQGVTTTQGSRPRPAWTPLTEAILTHLTPAHGSAEQGYAQP